MFSQSDIDTLMEGFWGILKRERYYGRRFTSKQQLIQMIEGYIHYYNTRRVQRNHGVFSFFSNTPASIIRETIRFIITGGTDIAQT